MKVLVEFMWRKNRDRGKIPDIEVRSDLIKINFPLYKSHFYPSLFFKIIIILSKSISKKCFHF